MEKTVITPIVGQVYHNVNGADYRCEECESNKAKMVRLRDGWTIWAHIVRQEENGDISWAYSTGGHWKNRDAFTN